MVLLMLFAAASTPISLGAPPTDIYRYGIKSAENKNIHMEFYLNGIDSKKQLPFVAKHKRTFALHCIA